MLVITLKLETPKGLIKKEASLWNVSNLARTSSYDFSFADRQKLAVNTQLTGYPRWCESTRGLAARCLALTISPEDSSDASLGWTRIQVNIGIRPGGRGAVRALAMATLGRCEDGTVDVGFAEDCNWTGFCAGLSARNHYEDEWAIAEHALRLSLFQLDSLPDAAPIELPVHEAGGLTFICMGDIPMPTRAAFEHRMAHSTRPLVEGYPGAVYAWDWKSFLGT